MSERGQRTRLAFGGIKAEVALLKTSGDPREARYEIRRGDEPSPTAKKRLREQEAQAMSGADDQHGTLAAMTADTPQGERPDRELDDSNPLGGARRHEEFAESARQMMGDPDPDPVRHGVWRGEGDAEEWVDLTDDLAEIDERTKLEDMEVVATISSQAVPRERVRDARYIATATPESARVLALVWLGLHEAGRVAVVRWTKRTNQALGIIVPRVLSRDARALVLLELEWRNNMRVPNLRVVGPHVLGNYERPITDEERAAALKLVDAFAAEPHALNGLRDERAEQRAELLEAARQGKEWEPPPEAEPVDDGAELAEALAAAASAR